MKDRKRLHTSVEIFVDWVANKSPYWAAYCAFMSGCLIALEKHPGVCPVGVGETLRQFFDNIVIKVTVPEATSVCQDDQLCAKLKAIIDGAGYGAQDIWYTNLTTKYWGFILVDAINTFNEINQIIMLCTVQHVCQSRASFVFNFYYHCSSLILRNMNGTSIFMHSREVVIQGNPLAVIVYTIGILSLIKKLKMEFPGVTHPWYAEDSIVLGIFARFEAYFHWLKVHGPGQGHYPEPSKSVMIVHPNNPESRNLFGLCCGFKVCMGTPYLGGYIGDNDSKCKWMK